MDDVKHNSIYLCMTSHIYISAPTRDLIMVVRAYVYACDILPELCATELIFAHPPTFITTILCPWIYHNQSKVFSCQRLFISEATIYVTLPAVCTSLNEFEPSRYDPLLLDMAL